MIMAMTELSYSLMFEHPEGTRVREVNDIATFNIPFPRLSFY